MKPKQICGDKCDDCGKTFKKLELFVIRQGFDPQTEQEFGLCTKCIQKIYRKKDNFKSWEEK